MTDAKPKSKAFKIRAARIARYRARRRPAPKGLLGRLGPGLITGASDDDPSGIATYSQAGAQFGYAMCWVMLFCFPLMAAIQEISARIGRVTGQGIAGNIRAHYSPWLLRAIVGLLLAANIINLGADLGAMGACVWRAARRGARRSCLANSIAKTRPSSTDSKERPRICLRRPERIHAGAGATRGLPKTHRS
jgi:hypothetical protein